MDMMSRPDNLNWCLSGRLSISNPNSVGRIMWPGQQRASELHNGNRSFMYDGSSSPGMFGAAEMGLSCSLASTVGTGGSNASPFLLALPDSPAKPECQLNTYVDFQSLDACRLLPADKFAVSRWMYEHA